MTDHPPIARDLAGRIQGQVLSDEPSRKAVSGDFGRMIYRVPAVVVRPSKAEDVAAVLRFARERGCAVSTRAAAHTQTGQALNEGGILLDMTSMSRILDVDAAGMTATCEAGVVWKDLVAHIAPKRLIPPVLTNNLNVTIGGTHSMAGLGVASWKYGAQGDNCLELEAVTPSGDIVTCSREKNDELFWATLSGLGNFAVLTKAKIRLREFKPNIRVHHLLYDDLKALMADARTVMSDARFDYIESWCVPCVQGFRKVEGVRQVFAQWFYPLHCTVEYEPGRPPDSQKLLSGLSFYKHTHTEEMAIHDFANRLEPLFDLWRRMGYWDNAHPWMETLLPWESAEPYITQVLENLPPPALGGGHILLWPSNGRTSNLKLFMRPDDEWIMGFGILPGVPKDLLDRAVEKLNMASDLSVLMGGKRYLSGLIHFDKARWQNHFGPYWGEVKRLKKKYDPHGILNPGFIDFSD